MKLHIHEALALTNDAMIKHNIEKDRRQNILTSIHTDYYNTLDEIRVRNVREKTSRESHITLDQIDCLIKSY